MVAWAAGPNLDKIGSIKPGFHIGPIGHLIG